jgi:serine protease Do
VVRQGDEQTIKVTLGRFEADRTASLSDHGGRSDGTASERLGATLAAVTPAAREQLGLDEDTDGVVITSLDGSGIAASAGLDVGDVILQIGDQAVHTPADVDRALRGAASDAMLFQIARGGNKIFVGVRLA